LNIQDSALARTFEIVMKDDSSLAVIHDTLDVRKRVLINMQTDLATTDHPTCATSLQRLEYLASPNIRSRVIILTTNGTKLNAPNSPQHLDQSSLQETRTSQGAIAATMLYPNPTSDGGATMSFSLASPRTLNMSLLTLGGEKVMDLARNVYRTQGDGQLAFALNNTAPGMYLVVLETDQGERVVQRLIVQ
jgi:hypothetical protein